METPAFANALMKEFEQQRYAVSSRGRNKLGALHNQGFLSCTPKVVPLNGFPNIALI